MTPQIIGLIQAETQTKTIGVDWKPKGIIIPKPNSTLVTTILGIQETKNPITVPRSTREVYFPRTRYTLDICFLYEKYYNVVVLPNDAVDSNIPE